MRYFCEPRSTFAENLAVDEALLLAAESGLQGEVLRVWEWPTPAIVLGSGSHLAEDVDEPSCKADGVLVARRSSGGGTVLLGPGCLLYTLVLDQSKTGELRRIRASYKYILQRLCSGLRGLAKGIECAGTSDLAIHDRKISGNAQQRKRRFLLHHGTLLYQFDVEIVGRYLRTPSRQPEYRRQRSHAEFLGNLPAGSAETIISALQKEWDAHEPLGEVPTDLTTSLVAEKYARDEWIHRR